MPVHKLVFEPEESHDVRSEYPCFLCQVELFGLQEHYKKYPDHAFKLSPELCHLYLLLLDFHALEHDPQVEHSPPTNNTKVTKRQLSRVHPKSLFYFRLAREWTENLHLIFARLKIMQLRRGVGNV